MQSRSLSFVSAHQARSSSVKALCDESTGAIALIGRSPCRVRVRKASQFEGRKFIATTLNGKKIAYPAVSPTPTSPTNDTAVAALVGTLVTGKS
jgi:hypothetical protein